MKESLTARARGIVRCLSFSPRLPRSFSRFLFPFSLFLFPFFSGCQSYEIVQTNVFADDDGNVIVVDYGRSESEHVNTFVSPTNGKTMDFHSKLVVKVTLPNGDRFKAWQCMNFLTTGTMYKTDNEEWMLLANGFSSVVYRQDEDNGKNYREVFRGVLCDVTEREVEKDDRWKVLPKGQGKSMKK